MRPTRRTILSLLAVPPLAAAATSCSSGESGGSGSITLRISTFSEWGYEPLLEEYQELNPDIVIEHNRFATSDEAKEQFQTSLGAGSGLADIVGVEGGWMPQVMQYPENFVDISAPEVEGRWDDWNVARATAEDGRLIGYATDIGPQCIAYRRDLFEAAGLPSDREEVVELFGGENATWESFYAVGETFLAAETGPAFFDASASIATSWADQFEAMWEDPDTGEIIALANPDLRNIFDVVTSHDDQSAHLARWSEDWTSAFQNDGFAVMTAPSWMLGVIEGNAAGVTGWDIAGVFPGGGVNSGGSYLTVPTQSEHPEEAQALAEWLTAPEQQIKAFRASGNFPSQIEAQESPEIQEITDPFFNDAPVGQILSEVASQIEIVPHMGDNHFAITGAFNSAINRVSVDRTHSPEESWSMFEDEIKGLG
nr:extracellular solute-binding protein [Brachybacterium massiliense]